MTMNFMTAKEIEGGFTWTLTSRLGQILRGIEPLYGPRDKDYTILGIEFSQSGPQISYPANCKNIVIQLSLFSQENLLSALYELSHEAIHLLSPSGGQMASVLEEGLATFHSWNYVLKVLDVDYRSRTSHKYREAALLVEKLLTQNPKFFIQVRSKQFDIGKIDVAHIKEFCPQIEDEEADLLVSSFEEFTPVMNLTKNDGFISRYENSIL